ncbi:MAG: hypothetical protein ABIJ96_08335 [Elusimicrobiota bacterium]
MTAMTFGQRLGVASLEGCDDAELRQALAKTKSEMGIDIAELAHLIVSWPSDSLEPIIFSFEPSANRKIARRILCLMKDLGRCSHPNWYHRVIFSFLEIFVDRPILVPIQWLGDRMGLNVGPLQMRILRWTSRLL